MGVVAMVCIVDPSQSGSPPLREVEGKRGFVRPRRREEGGMGVSAGRRSYPCSCRNDGNRPVRRRKRRKEKDGAVHHGRRILCPRQGGGMEKGVGCRRPPFALRCGKERNSHRDQERKQGERVSLMSSSFDFFRFALQNGMKGLKKMQRSEGRRKKKT